MHTHTITLTNPAYKPVTLQEAKDFLMVDFPDFDSLIEMLLDAAVSASQKSTGHVYQPATVTVTTDDCENAYPLPYADFWTRPVDTEVSVGFRRYSYPTGFAEGALPADLRQAILQRVAEGFKYREDSVAEAVNQTSNASIYTEFSYRVNPMI